MTRSILLALLSSLLVLATASSLTIQSPRFSILASDGSQLRSESLSLKELPAPLTLGQSDVLKMSFNVQETGGGKGVRPHQTFLRFYDAESGEEGIQPVRVTSSGKAKFELNMARPPASLPPTTTNPLRVTLLLGSFTHSPVKIDLFDLVIPASQPAPQHPDEESFHLRPEIAHTFRAPQKTPPQAVSAFFAGIVVSPWLVLITLWSAVPHKLPHLSSPNILAFVSLLAALEGLLFWYWVDLKLGQVLAYGAVLGCFTLAAGNRALSSVAKWRLGK